MMQSRRARVARMRRWACSVICWPRVRWCQRLGSISQDRLHGSHRARRTTVQPAQLSLLPEQYPAPAVSILSHLPEPEASEAIRQLARLIAKAAPGQREVVTDE